MTKISRRGEADIRFYLSNRHHLSFSGSAETVQFDPRGVSFVEAFMALDAQGKSLPTRHPRALLTLLKAKASANLHVKMYAQARAEGTMTLPELRAICMAAKAPAWVRKAVEKQKEKLRAEGVTMIVE